MTMHETLRKACVKARTRAKHSPSFEYYAWVAWFLARDAWIHVRCMFRSSRYQHDDIDMLVHLPSMV